MRRFRHYFHGQLHRRLFLWFGAAILVSALAGAFAMHSFTGESGYSWHRSAQQMAERFAHVWDSPSDLDALAQSMARRLGADLTVTDPEGRILNSAGTPCTKPTIVSRVVREEQLLGYVRLCTSRHYPLARRGLLALFLAGVILWMAAGFVARRLSKPLWELSQVAQKLGAGQLSSRMHQSGRHGSEVKEIQLLSDSINDMAERIQRQIADQRELLAAVSHELRTPLARIRILVELLRSSNADAKTLDELDKEVIEIDSLVGELLTSSRLDFAALNMRTLDAGEVARRALERVGVNPSLLMLETQELQFQGDANLLARALANMIQNAQQHGGGLSALRVRRGVGRVVFEVEDQGPGFAPGEEKRAFVAFHRRTAEGEGKSSSGLGLGLALVQRIAEAHGGGARASNLPQGGALVALELPAFPPGR